MPPLALPRPELAPLPPEAGLPPVAVEPAVGSLLHASTCALAPKATQARMVHCFTFVLPLALASLFRGGQHGQHRPVRGSCRWKVGIVMESEKAASFGLIFLDPNFLDPIRRL